jgi:hypothetical protein
MIDLTAGGSLALCFFYYFVSRSSFSDYVPPSSQISINGHPSSKPYTLNSTNNDPSPPMTPNELEGGYSNRWKGNKLWNPRSRDDEVPQSSIPLLSEDQDQEFASSNPRNGRIMIREEDIVADRDD